MSGRDVEGALPAIAPNTWVNVTPVYVGAPNGGYLSPMTFNDISVYDPGSRRTISFERWYDSVRGMSIYANAVIAYEPSGNEAAVLKLNNWYIKPTGSGNNTTEPMPQNSADPTPVDRHPFGGFALDPNTSAIYLANGANQSANGGQHPNDTWKFSLTSRSWTKLTATATPVVDVGSYSGMVYDNLTRKIAYLVSQFPNGTTTWLLDPATDRWAAAPKDSTAAPVYVASAGIAYDSRRNLVLAYGGGYNTSSPASPKLWAYSVAQNRWTALADAPVAATSPEFAYDSLHDVFLAIVEQKTLVYNPRTNTWLLLSATINRGTNLNRQNLAYNAAQDLFVYQGGAWDKPVWALFRYADGAPTAPPVPGSPTNVSGIAVSSSQINLTWTAPAGGPAVTGYRVYRNGQQVGTSPLPNFVDTGLMPATTYYYTVSAYDASGAGSTPSASTSVTTASGTPTPPTPVGTGKLGRGCTTAWFIDEDCDGYGVGARSSGVYGEPGLGDKPDADDTLASLNTAQSLITAYDTNANGRVDYTEMQTFLKDRKGITANNLYYISTTGNNATAAPNDSTKPYATWHVPPAGSSTYGVWQYLKPGDVVIYKDGTYDNPYIGGGSPPMKSGTAGSPIVLMAAPGERVLFTTTNTAIDSSSTHDIIVDGFLVDNPNNTGYGPGISFNTTKNAIFRNIELQRFNYVSSMQDLHDITIDKWVIHHNREHGLYLGARELPGSNITVKNSILYRNGVWDGFGAIQYNGRVTNLKIEGNILHSNGQWGISLKQGVSNSVIQNNLIFNNQGHGIIFDIYPGDCYVGGTICPYSQTGNLIVNNTIWIGRFDQVGAVPSIPENASAVLLARNVGVKGDSFDQGKNTFQNNIFVTYNGYVFRSISTDDWLSTSSFKNNVIYRVGGAGGVVLFGDATPYSFTNFQSTFTLATGNTFANPLFGDANISYWNTPEKFNLQLTGGSPALGFGIAPNAPTYDVRGLPRPMPPDAGAYGGQGGTATLPPTAPRNVRIIR